MEIAQKIWPQWHQEFIALLSPIVMDVLRQDPFQINNQVIQPTISEIISPSTCGNSNGQIDITINPPGVYNFIWSNGNTTEDLQNILSGAYAVTVTNTNGCTASANFLVSDTTSNFSITGTLLHHTSCTGANGSIDLTVTPAGNYQFIWSNGATTEDLQFLLPGNYNVTVSDALHCSNVSGFTIENNVVDLAIEETITPVLCGEVNGSIDLKVTPPTGNSFIWSNGSTQEDLQDILQGLYSVTITAQNGCTWSSSFSVPGSEAVSIDIAADLGSTSSDSITITVELNIETGAVDTVMWFPGNLFNCQQDFCLQQTILKPLQPVDIRVIVIDTNGCSGEAVLRIDIGIDPKVYIPNVFSPNNDGFNDWFTVYGNNEVKEVIEMQIFDRWGNNVFINTQFPPNEENYGWDGTFKNKDMNPAVFAYWAQVRFYRWIGRIL
jgi:gliding motility-associated-like protein